MSFNCRICNSNQIKGQYNVREMMFGTKTEYNYSGCAECGVIQINEPIRDSKLLYPNEYYSFSDSEKISISKKIRNYFFIKVVTAELGMQTLIGHLLVRIKSSLEARAISPFIKKTDKILDIGCGTGELIRALKYLGYKYVSGIDPYINKTINDDILIQKKTVNELDLNEKYDVIMLHHSFEHIESPLLELKSIYNILKETGNLIIRIPVSDSLAFEKYKENWYQFDAPRHIFLHTNNSMKFLAKNSGFEIKEIINDSQVSQFIVSEQYEKGISLNAPDSYYTSIFRRINPFRKKHFTRKRIKELLFETKRVNKINIGDQRIYLLKKNTLQNYSTHSN